MRARALRFAGGRPAGERAALLDEYAAELLVLDRPADALDASNEALSCWREADDRRGLGDSLRRRCAILRVRGDGEPAIAAALAAVAALEPDGNSLDLARALAVLAQVHMTRAEYAESESLAERGLAIAREHRDEELDIHLLTTLAAARSCVGDETGSDLMRATLARAQAAGLDEATARLWYNLIGHLAFGSRDPHGALADLEQALRFANSRDLVQMAAGVRMFRGRCSSERGPVERGRRGCRTPARAHRELGSDPVQGARCAGADQCASRRVRGLGAPRRDVVGGRTLTGAADWSDRRGPLVPKRPGLPGTSQCAPSRPGRGWRHSPEWDSGGPPASSLCFSCDPKE